MLLVLSAMLAGGAWLGVRFARMLTRARPAMRRRTAVWLGVAAVAPLLFFFALWGLFAYLVMILAAGDLAGLCLSRWRWGGMWWGKAWRGGMTGVALAVCVCAYGFYHVLDIRVTRYDITLSKPQAGRPVPHSKLRAVLITDTHLGKAIRAPQLDALAARVNALAPDIVFLGGDIYDDKTPPELVDHSMGVWRALKAPLGVWYVGGNHEHARYAGAHMAGVFPRLKAAGVRVLEDEHALVGGAFYVVGRKDLSIRDRLGAEELTRALDKTRPVIMLDHQPVGMARTADAGVDLLLCGHTHAGQIWPFGYAVRLLSRNEVVYGRARFGNMQAIVSSGAGAWGFSMRVGTNSEIVLLDIAFAPETSKGNAP
ncbi:MAG: metallophosphoesterase [Kiritimatiellaeota bacterium]|nr:metallophosphoesterase [Kiritimatiellota bacterium]